ncbi:MAG: TetR/AcrR family transcriptional regulator [Roseiflexaceae bacterium]
MGIRERRERERQELRQAILQAAHTIGAGEGWQNLTIRKVADQIEYSPPVIYEHFASKDAILAELLRNGTKQLRESMRAAWAAATTPEQGLIAVGWAYWQFAYDQPAIYQVIFGIGGVPFCPEELEAEVAIITADMVEQLHALQAAGYGAIGDPLDALDLLWATLHGIIALHMSAYIDGGSARAERLIAQALQTHLIAWRTPTT